MKKETKITIIFLVIIALVVCAFTFSKKSTKSESKDESKQQQSHSSVKQSENIEIVPTMSDKVYSDSTWCGVFQLVWNDMKRELVGGDVVFNPQEEIVENLNKEEFNEDMISDKYYFKIYGLKTLELKEKIEKGIKEKFNQTSDILDDFDWSEEGLNDPDNGDVDRYFFYAMLYRKFEFVKQFDKLEDGEFADKYENIKYFGIDENTSESVGEQIDVLYYNSKDDFAIVLNTKTDDEVIFCKNPEGTNFNEIYENMNKKEMQYKGKRRFQDVDEFKAPNLEFNEKKEYTELESKEFETKRGIGMIEKAIQTVKFSINEKGGEVKSEAAIDVIETTSAIDELPEKVEPRYFYVDDTFVVFLREAGKDAPYFATRVEDITKFQ